MKRTYINQSLQSFEVGNQTITGSYFRLIFHLLSIVPLFIAAACFSFYDYAHANSWYLIIAIQLAAFIFLGILHLFISENRTAFWFSFEKKDGLNNTVIFSALLFLITIALFLFANRNLVLLSVAFSAAFFLPTITSYTYQQFLVLPKPQQRIWFPQRNLIDNKSFVFVNSIGIKIKLSLLCSEKKSSAIDVVVPSHMELGKIFYFFVIQQQSEGINIETIDERNNTIGWQFYLEKYSGASLRLLNPDFDLRENGIEDRSIIIAERVYAVKSVISKIKKQLK